MSEAAPAQIDLLLFELAGQTYGADASQVVRIDRQGEGRRSGQRLSDAARALVVKTPAGEEGQVNVDGVKGVATVPVDELRRLPPAAGGVPFAIGVWLDQGDTVLLVDLLDMLKAR